MSEKFEQNQLDVVVDGVVITMIQDKMMKTIEMTIKMRIRHPSGSSAGVKLLMFEKRTKQEALTKRARTHTPTLPYQCAFSGQNGRVRVCVFEHFRI